MKTKVVRDPLYGYIEFNEIEGMVVDNLFFQRLRRIAQTQQTCLVYPNITHTRFAHSLGVMHLMGSSFDNLYLKLLNKKKEKEVLQNVAFRNTLRMGLRIGALLHDVGHMTFSHWLEELLSEYSSSSSSETELNFRNHEELGYYLSKYVILKRLRDSLEKMESLSTQLYDGNRNGPALLCFIAESMLYPPSMLKDEIIKREKNFSFRNMFDQYMSVVSSIAKDWNIADNEILSIIKEVVFPFYQLLHCWVFTIDELDYLSRDNLFAGTEFGQIDWVRLIRNMSISYSKNEKNKFTYLTIDDIRRVYHNLELFYISYSHSYCFLYGHAVVKYFDKLAIMLAQNLQKLKDNFKRNFDNIKASLSEISSLDSKDMFYDIKFKIHEVELFRELSKLVDAVFIQDLITEYTLNFKELLRKIPNTWQPSKEQLEVLNKMYEYLSRGPTSFKILSRVIAYPNKLENINKKDSMDKDWEKIIIKMRNHLSQNERLNEGEDFLIYNWGFISPKGIKFCPLNTPIAEGITFEEFLSTIQANKSYIYYIAYLFLSKKLTKEKKNDINKNIREKFFKELQGLKHLKLKIFY